MLTPRVSRACALNLERQASNERLNPGQQVDRVLGRDFNRPITEHAIGQQRAEQLANALDTEGTMLETSNIAEANRGSRTAHCATTAQRMWGQSGGQGVMSEMLTCRRWRLCRWSALVRRLQQAPLEFGD